MANNRDEEMINREIIYHKELRKIQDRNQDRVEALDEYNADNGPKPSREEFHELNGPVLSPEQMHKEAQGRADDRMEEQKKLEKSGLTRDQQGGKIVEKEQSQQQLSAKRRRRRSTGRDRDDGRSLDMD